jgi:hypothetical protein
MTTSQSMSVSGVNPLTETQTTAIQALLLAPASFNLTSGKYGILLSNGSVARLPSFSYLNVGSLASPISTTTINSSFGVIATAVPLNVGPLVVSSIIDAMSLIVISGSASSALNLITAVGTANSPSTDLGSIYTASLVGYGAGNSIIQLKERIVISSATTMQSQITSITNGVNFGEFTTTGKVSASLDNFYSLGYYATPGAGTDTLRLIYSDVKVYR